VTQCLAGLRVKKKLIVNEMQLFLCSRMMPLELAGSGHKALHILNIGKD
jgi:hypothetical protein